LCLEIALAWLLTRVYNASGRTLFLTSRSHVVLIRNNRAVGLLAWATRWATGRRRPLSWWLPLCAWQR